MFSFCTIPLCLAVYIERYNLICITVLRLQGLLCGPLRVLVLQIAKQLSEARFHIWIRIFSIHRNRRTPYLHRIRTRFISLNRLTLPWRLTMGALSRRCRHETATVLAGNHHNLFHNNFPRCGNLSLLQWLMNPHKINDHEDHRQAKNKEQRNKNNPKRIHDSTSPQHDYRIYEPQLSKRASSPVVLHQSIHPPIAHNIDACRCSTSFIPLPTCRFTIDSSFFRRSHLWKEQVREP